VRPHDTKGAFKLEFFNETMIFGLIYHLMMFTDFLPLERQENLGLTMIIFTLALIGFNLSILGIKTIRGWINSCKSKGIRSRADLCKAIKQKCKKKKPETTESAALELQA
jgi:hypothetical protein